MDIRGNQGGSAARAARLLLILVAVLTATVVPAPVHASTVPPDSENGIDAGTRDIRDPHKRVPVEPYVDASKYFWIWSKGGLGYLLRNTSSAAIGEILAYDLETGESAGQKLLSPQGFGAGRTRSEADFFGYSPIMSVDEDGGRLFLATEGSLGEAVRGHACTSGTTNCFNGVSVLDATSLELIRHIPVPTLGVDGRPYNAQVTAVTFDPGDAERPQKVFVLLQDATTHPHALDGLGPREFARNFVYLAQLDPNEGVMDWMVLVEPCRGARHGYSANTNERLTHIHHEAAVFRNSADAIYVGCHFITPSLGAGVVRLGLNAEGVPPQAYTVPSAPEVDTAEPPSQPPPAGSPEYLESQQGVTGPDLVYEIIADPPSGRVLMQVIAGTPRAAVWWVFDTRVMQFVGTIGIGGPNAIAWMHSGIASNGRLYSMGSRFEEAGRVFEGGLFVADIRRTPVPQALVYPEFSGRVGWPNANRSRMTLSFQAMPDGTMRIWHVDRNGRSSEHSPAYHALDDVRPPGALVAAPDFDGRTLDLEEREGVTAASLDGAARGFGFRAVLIGGAEAATRAGPVDPVGTAYQCGEPYPEGEAGNVPSVIRRVDSLRRGRPTSVDPNATTVPCEALGVKLQDPCLQPSREAVFAFVGPQGPAVVDDSGARGGAVAFTIDSGTLADAKAPTSRCAQTEWDALWSTALFGRPPVGEPGADTARLTVAAECISSSGVPRARAGDPVTQGFSATANCDPSETSGHAYARAVGVPGLSVAESLSSFRIYRDPSRGVVSRVESAARGISIDGVVRIDTVRGIAESWANGRAQPLGSQDRPEGYEPNCDFERSAGTCFRRHLFGVWTPGYQCGPCGDEQAFVHAVNAVFGRDASVRLREPDARLRQGAENGFTAAIQKPETERFADLVLNNDTMQTMLPTLEIVRYAGPNRLLTRGGSRGRQIYQFAGVEVSSSYGITCLLVYDEASNTCAAQGEPPGSIQISLSDPDGRPLAGGAFEVRADVDADGVLGLKDALLPNGACVTAQDGVGTCRFDSLKPGPYLVGQVAAPPGYGKSAEPFVVELGSGEARTVAFTNVSNLSAVELKATDENGQPLNGATFAAYPDPDADGKVAPDAKPAAECTTDAQGVCRMQVPAGSYVLVQTSAPGGLEGIEPVPFTFASGGQVAAVTVTNYPPDTPQAPSSAPAPQAPVYTPPVDVAPPTEVVEPGYTPPVDSEPLPETAPGPSLSEKVGGTVVQVVRAPGDAVRLLSRDPKQAVAWTAAIALFSLAAIAVRRRQAARLLIDAQ